MTRREIAATFRFYEELNEFLPSDQRKRDNLLRCPAGAPLGHLIETFGVPHTEVEIALVNGRSVGLEHLLEEGDRVAVYPVFECFDVTPLVRIRAQSLRQLRFLADAHLGKLTRHLRMLGFDTRWFERDPGDPRLADLASREGRILLTRDRALLMHRKVTHGCFVHPRRPLEQLAYLFDRLQLEGAMAPFTRCIECNRPIREIASRDVIGRVPPRVRKAHQDFRYCERCDKVYWKGSHFCRMQRVIEGLRRRDGGSGCSESEQDDQ